MNFQAILFEPRGEGAQRYDHVTDIAESDDPQVLCDVVSDNWNLTRRKVGSFKVELRTVVTSFGDNSDVGTAHHVNPVDGKLVVQTPAGLVPFLDWCVRQKQVYLASLPTAEQKLLDGLTSVYSTLEALSTGDEARSIRSDLARARDAVAAATWVLKACEGGVR